MATLHLKLEQVNFAAEDCESLLTDADPTANVVNAATDFKPQTESGSPLLVETNSSEVCVNTGASTKERTSSVSSDANYVSNGVAVNPDLVQGSIRPSQPQVHGGNSHFLFGHNQSSRHSSRGRSSDPVYPGITNEVANYLNQVNPELVCKMEAALVPDNNKSSSSKKTRLPGLAHSNLKHLANASDALALQESVIGNRMIQPASPDVVAQVIASVHHQSRVMEGFSHRNVIYTSDSLPSTPSHTSVGPSSPAAAPQKAIKPIHTVVHAQMHDSKQPTTITVANKEAGKQQLYRVPPERITTVTERKSGWFSATSSTPNSDTEVTRAQHLERESCKRNKRQSVTSNSQSSVCSSRSSSVSHQDCSPVQSDDRLDTKAQGCDVFSNGDEDSKTFAERIAQETTSPFTMPDYHQRSCHSTSARSVCSDVDSVYSERFELDSNYSDRLETQSNISEMSSVSGIEEEMYRIRKLLLEVPTTTDDHPEFHRHSVLLGRTAGIVVPDVLEGPARAVVDQDVFFEIQRQKANLEGQLEALKLEVEEAVRQRTSLQSQLSSVQALLKAKTMESQLDEGEKENLSSKVKALQEACRRAEIAVAQLHANIDSKMTEIANLKDELKEAEEANARLRIDIEEVRVDLDAKEGAVQGLKTKIAELHVEVQVTEQNKIQAENDSRVMRTEMDALQKSREWYQQQLHAAQDSRSKIQQDFISLQTANATHSNHLERVRSENAVLRRNMAELQQRAVKEKEVLMRHLETIEADMMEREATFVQIQRDKGEAEDMLTKRMQRVEEEKAKLSSTSFSLSDLEHQLEAAKKDLSTKDSALMAFDKDRGELMKRLTIAQKAVGEKDMELHEAGEKSARLQEKLKELEIALRSKDEQLLALKADKMAVDLALTGAQKEKREVDDALQGLRQNLQKLEGNLKRMKNDLALKNASADQLTREKQKLEEELVSAEQRALALQRNYESYGADVKSRDATIEQLTAEKLNYGEELSLAREQLRQYMDSLTEKTSLCEKLSADVTRLTGEHRASLSAVQNNAAEERAAFQAKICDLEEEIEEVSQRHRRVSSAVDAVDQLRKASGETGQYPVYEDNLSDCGVHHQGARHERRGSQDLGDGASIFHDPSTDLEQSGTTSDGQSVATVVLQWREAFEEEMAAVRSQLELNERRVERYLTEKKLMEAKLVQVQHQNDELRRLTSIGAHEVADSDENAEKQIRTQLEVYRNKIQELENVLCLSSAKDLSSSLLSAGSPSTKGSFSVEIETQTDNVSFMKHVLEQDNNHSSEVGHLESALLTLKTEQQERQRVYDSNTKVLTRKLKEVMKARKKLEKELADTKDLLTVAKNIEKTSVSVPMATIPTTNGHSIAVEGSKDTPRTAVINPDPTRRRDPKREVLHYKARVKDLQLRLAEVQEKYDAMKNKAEANEQLALDLEKEKGRLAGVSHSNLMLKQQTNTLEAALAERETTVSELGLTTRDLSHKREEEIAQTRERLRDLEVALSAEQETGKELRRQIFASKRECSGLKKQLASLRSGVEGANQLAEAKKTELAALQTEMDRRCGLEAKLKSQLDAALVTQRKMAAELEKMKQEAAEGQTKDGLLAEQMKTLSWHLRQKNQENSALNERLSLMESRHKEDLDGLRQTLQVTRAELENIKAELSNTMKEKFGYQSQVTELRTALKASLEQSKNLRTKDTSQPGKDVSAKFILDLKVPDSPMPYDETFIASLLQQCAVTPQSRPLSNLQSCLNTLKQEMDILQKQLHEQSEGLS